MSDVPPIAPPRPRPGATVVALLLVAALAGTAAAVLAGVAAAGTGNGSGPPAPEECCPQGGPPPAPATAPSGTPSQTPGGTPSAGPTREPPLPLCIVGSWRVTSETYLIEFYTDVAAIPFTSSGREFEFRPDGTGTIFWDDVVSTASYQGDALRVEWRGRAEFTWSADETTITYHAYTRANATWSTHVNSRRTNSGEMEPDPDLDEVDQYRCGGDELAERNQATGYQASWVRTGGYGVYG